MLGIVGDAIALYRNGAGEGTGLTLQQVNADIHLEPGEALIAALFQSLAIDLRVMGLSGTGITTDLVAELAAEHLVNGNVVRFACQIPAGHLNAADAARLARITAKLLDLAKNLLDIAGILAQHSALQHQSLQGAGSITHFAEAINPLVGIDADDGVRHRRTPDGGDAEIGDLQLRRFRVPIDVLRGRFEDLISLEGHASPAKK